MGYRLHIHGMGASKKVLEERICTVPRDSVLISGKFTHSVLTSCGERRHLPRIRYGNSAKTYNFHRSKYRSAGRNSGPLSSREANWQN